MFTGYRTPSYRTEADAQTAIEQAFAGEPNEIAHHVPTEREAGEWIIVWTYTPRQ